MNISPFVYSYPSEFFQAKPSAIECVICHDVPNPESGFYDKKCGKCLCYSCLNQLQDSLVCPYCRDTAHYSFIKENKPLTHMILNTKSTCLFCDTEEVEVSEISTHFIHCPKRFKVCHPLIEFDLSTKKLVVNQLSAMLLAQIQKPVRVVSVAGSYQIGKSTMLNHSLVDYLDTEQQFETGKGIRATTKGAHCAIHFIDSEEFCTLYVDTEGLGEKHSSFSLNCLVFLLSNHYVFRVRKNILVHEKKEMENIAQLSSVLNPKKTSISKIVTIAVTDTEDEEVKDFVEENKELVDVLSKHSITDVKNTIHADFKANRGVEEYQSQVKKIFSKATIEKYKNGLELTIHLQQLLDIVNTCKSVDEIAQVGIQAFYLSLKQKVVTLYSSKMQEYISELDESSDPHDQIETFSIQAEKESLQLFDTEAIPDEKDKYKQEILDAMKSFKRVMQKLVKTYVRNNGSSDGLTNFLIGSISGGILTVGMFGAFSYAPVVLSLLPRASSVVSFASSAVVRSAQAAYVLMLKAREKMPAVDISALFSAVKQKMFKRK